MLQMQEGSLHMLKYDTSPNKQRQIQKAETQKAMMEKKKCFSSLHAWIFELIYSVRILGVSGRVPNISKDYSPVAFSKHFMTMCSLAGFLHMLTFVEPHDRWDAPSWVRKWTNLWVCLLRRTVRMLFLDRLLWLFRLLLSKVFSA